jgi:excisionase family DNA binding protein
VAQQLGVSPVTVRHWALDGKLEFITTPGGHRRFLQEQVDQFVQAHGVNKASNRTPKICVLIVEDDRQLSEYLSDYIESLNAPIDCAVANNGFEAGELVHEFNPDLVLLDLMMPTMDGFAVCQRIKQNPKTRHIQVVAMTGYPSQENVQRIINAGAETCLSKPLDTNQLLELFNHTLEQHGAATI